MRAWFECSWDMERQRLFATAMATRRSPKRYLTIVGEAECISVLLAAGADPDSDNDYGVSPRSLAYTIANYDMPKFF